MMAPGKVRLTQKIKAKQGSARRHMIVSEARRILSRKPYRFDRRRDFTVWELQLASELAHEVRG